MAVCIRLKRLGRANRAFWRICATDKRTARDGRVLEELGHYDPLLGDQDKVKLKRDRLVDWLKRGAVPSDTVAQLMAHLGLDAKGNEVPPRPWKKKKKAPPPPAAARVAAEKEKKAAEKEKKPAEAKAAEKEKKPAEAKVAEKEKKPAEPEPAEGEAKKE